MHPGVTQFVTFQLYDSDYFDTLIRDEAHLLKAVRYTEQNAVKALLAKTAQEWPWCSARHRDEYGRLLLKNQFRSAAFTPPHAPYSGCRCNS